MMRQNGRESIAQIGYRGALKLVPINELLLSPTGIRHNHLTPIKRMISKLCKNSDFFFENCR